MRGRAMIGLTALVGLALLVYLLADVLLPFVAGLALAYLLDPIADRLERLGLGRLTASLLILAVFVVGLVVALLLVVPLAANQVSALVATLPGMVSRCRGSSLTGPGRSWSGWGAPMRSPTCNPRSAPWWGRAAPGSWPS